MSYSQEGVSAARGTRWACPLACVAFSSLRLLPSIVFPTRRRGYRSMCYLCQLILYCKPLPCGYNLHNHQF